MTKTKILVVEDEAIVARDIVQSLLRLGYDPVARTPRGEEAIVLVDQLRPDLVLMDIHLAGDLDGVGAARVIRERFGIPVIFLTAYTDDSDLQRAKPVESYGRIIKPFEEWELGSVIELGLGQRRDEMRLRDRSG